MLCRYLWLVFWACFWSGDPSWTMRCPPAQPPGRCSIWMCAARAGQSWGSRHARWGGGMGGGVGASWARPRSCCGRRGLATTQWTCTGAGHTLLSGAGKLSWSNCSSKRIIIDHGHCLRKTLEITFNGKILAIPRGFVELWLVECRAAGWCRGQPAVVSIHQPTDAECNVLPGRTEIFSTIPVWGG